MRARAWILLAAMVLAAAGLSAGIAAAAYDGRARAAQPEPTGGYILADYEGSIGVFSGGELIMLTNVKLDGLRQADRALLEAGIEVDSYEALMRLLQDFDE